MKTRSLGIASLILLTLTVLWIVLVIWDTASAGPMETFEQVLAHVARLSGTFYLTYVNAALLTLCTVIWLAGLYVYCKPHLSEWSAVTGLICTPIYGVLNLFAYLSQITIVPALLSLHRLPEYQAASEVLLRMTIHQWPGSAVGFFNSLAYAVLSIPSIIFGLALGKHGRIMRFGGILFALSGVASIIGVIGSLVGNALLGSGVVVGGVLFLLALAAMSWALLREEAK